MSEGSWLCSKTDDFMRNALIYLILLFFCVSASAQEADTSHVHDSLRFHAGRSIPMTGSFLLPLQERDSVLVADQLVYGFELKKVEDGTLLALPEWKNDERGGVMAVSQWQLDTVKVTKQKKGMPALLDIRGGLTITSFDEGLYELPPIMVGRLSRDGVLDTLVFDPVQLEVRTMPIDTATFVPHDIKGQIRYPVTFREVAPWFGTGLLAAGLVVLTVWLIMRYRRRHDPEFARKEPAHIIALRKLDQYRGNKMWAPEKQKVFYSGVTDALREYMASRYGVPAMEMTTAEIFKEMKSEDVPEELMTAVKELFERADFVKFAKFVASDDDNASVLPLAVRFVTETYQTDIEEDAGSSAGTAGSEVQDDVKDGGTE